MLIGNHDFANQQPIRCSSDQPRSVYRRRPINIMLTRHVTVLAEVTDRWVPTQSRVAPAGQTTVTGVPLSPAASTTSAVPP